MSGRRSEESLPLTLISCEESPWQLNYDSHNNTTADEEKVKWHVQIKRFSWCRGFQKEK